MNSINIDNIKAPERIIEESVIDKINNKTKPVGSLGVLEEVARKIAIVQNSLNPQFINPHIVVFAGDHGIANEGVSAYPQDVTWQMVENFLAGGTAINVFAKSANIDLLIVDAGVNHDFVNKKLINKKIAYGTKNFLSQSAMSAYECISSFTKGQEVADEVFAKGANVIGFGEMGIGNTSSASMLTHLLTNIPLEECIGRGTGLDDDGLKNKIAILYQALNSYNKQVNRKDVLSIASYFGGFEIVMMAGAMAKAASLGMVVIVDGFIATAAYLIAFSLNHNISHYAIFSHQSQESGHKKQLQWLQVKALLSLELRLGEGSGAALAYPIINQALVMMTKMASFEDAKVSKG